MRTVAIVLAIMLVSGTAISVSAKDPDKTGAIEGEVIRVDSDTIVLKKLKDGEEVHLRLGPSTQTTGQIKPGDKVEAFISPQGVTTSVQPLTGGFRR